MKKILNVYCNSIRYTIILIVNSKTTNFNYVVIFISRIKSIAKFKLSINLKNILQYLVKNIVTIFLKNIKAKILIQLYFNLSN